MGGWPLMGTPSSRSFLDAEPIRVELIRRLAAGEHSLEQLAREYDVGMATIHRFRQRWADEILAAVEDVVGRVLADDSWISNVREQVKVAESRVEAWLGRIDETRRRLADGELDYETATRLEDLATKRIYGGLELVAKLEGRLGSGAQASVADPVAYVLRSAVEPTPPEPAGLDS